ncbi:MAG: hypothetical protein JO190_07125 [Candidatus Eremiobacteraeota bacterium]|nr:hypothetical protein [Candidatus Eremiobacteraeota bacterium]MBV8497721.1 hypothetical protein [Candidatus Eremiobacteraeota bacterium]
MRPPENEPGPEELRELLDEEESKLLDQPEIPDDVKSELTERLERRREADTGEES